MGAGQASAAAEVLRLEQEAKRLDWLVQAAESAVSKFPTGWILGVAAAFGVWCAFALGSGNFVGVAVFAAAFIGCHYKERELTKEAQTLRMQRFTVGESLRLLRQLSEQEQAP